jgi:uncharacterized protein (TIGR03435 family)
MRPTPLDRQRLFLLAVGCLALMPPVSLTARAGGQAPSSASPAFEVATIKPSDPGRPEDNARFGFNAAGSFQAKSQTLKQLIEFVFDMSYFNVDQRIIGGPKWLGSTKFDITAKCGEQTVRGFGKMSLKEQLRTEQSMVQALLAERFALRMHHETRPLPVFALVLAHEGSKMQPSASPTLDELNDPAGPPGNWKAHGVTMKAFASILSSLPEFGGKIVLDKTGLTGGYDFALKWTPDPATLDPTLDPRIGASAAGDRANPDSSAPTLLTALKEQLGLRLEPSKEPVDVIVVDWAEMPSRN